MRLVALKEGLFSTTLLFLFFVLEPLGLKATYAQEYVPYNEMPGYVKHIYLYKNDQITDNCWTNSNTVVSKTKLLLENNGIQVIDYLPAFPNIFSPVLAISAIGYRTDGLCVGSATVEIYNFGDLRYGGGDAKPEYLFRTKVSVFSDTSVFSIGTNFNSQIDDFVEGSVSEFLADSVSARRSPSHSRFFELYPGFSEKPMTREKWEELLSGVKDSSQ